MTEENASEGEMEADQSAVATPKGSRQQKMIKIS